MIASLRGIARRTRAPRALALLCACTAPAAAAEFVPTGVIYYDALEAHPDARPLADADKVRSARLGFGVKAERWQIAVEHEFTDRSTPDAYLQLTPRKGHWLRAGQFKMPFLLEDATSARQTPLMEHSLLGALAIGRRIGLAYGYADATRAYAAGAYGQRLDGKNEGVGVAARASRAFLRSEAGLLHLGLGAAAEWPREERLRVSSKPESALASASLVDTGAVPGVERHARAGLEALWLRGAWSLQGEAAAVRAEDAAGRPLRGNGGYALASWSPSGHARSYRNGSVGAPSPGDGTAWELFVRYGALDLDSPAARGGRQSDWTFGATWYAGRHVRAMANYVVASSRRRGVEDDPRLLQVRLQLAF